MIVLLLLLTFTVTKIQKMLLSPLCCIMMSILTCSCMDVYISMRARWFTSVWMKILIITAALSCNHDKEHIRRFYILPSNFLQEAEKVYLPKRAVNLCRVCRAQTKLHDKEEGVPRYTHIQLGRKMIKTWTTHSTVQWHVQAKHTHTHTHTHTHRVNCGAGLDPIRLSHPPTHSLHQLFLWKAPESDLSFWRNQMGESKTNTWITESQTLMCFCNLLFQSRVSGFYQLTFVFEVSVTAALENQRSRLLLRCTSSFSVVRGCTSVVHHMWFLV